MGRDNCRVRVCGSEKDTGHVELVACPYIIILGSCVIENVAQFCELDWLYFADRSDLLTPNFTINTTYI